MNLGTRRALAKAFTNSTESSAGTVGANKVIKRGLFGFESVDNFWPCRDGVNPRIGFILELIGPVPSVFVGQLLGLYDHAGSLVSWENSNAGDGRQK